MSIIKTEFGNNVEVFLAIKIAVVDEFINKIIDAFNGKINIQTIDNGFYDFG